MNDLLYETRLGEIGGSPFAKSPVPPQPNCDNKANYRIPSPAALTVLLASELHF